MRVACALFVILLFPAHAFADDFGPARDVRDVAFAAKRLLAHRLRAAGANPSVTAVREAVVVRDQALISWSNGGASGIMGLVRYADRWWDAFDAPSALGSAQCADVPRATFPLRAHPPAVSLSDAGFSNEVIAAASAHNAAVAAYISNHGPSRDRSHGAIACDGATAAAASLNGSAYDVKFSGNVRIRTRPPTPAEILLDPTPAHGFGGSTSVVFLYVDVPQAAAPQAFAPRSTLDVWVPWVLDDAIEYDLQLFTTPKAVGPVKGSVHDNVLHFDLPAFALPAGETMGEIDGDWN